MRQPRGKDLPPGTREWPVIGQALPLLRDPLGLFQQAAARGDVSTVPVKRIPLRLVNHPEVNREAMVTNRQRMGRGSATFEVFGWFQGKGVSASDGAYHRQQRRIMQLLFHWNQVEGYGQAIGEIAEQTAGVADSLKDITLLLRSGEYQEGSEGRRDRQGSLGTPRPEQCEQHRGDADLHRGGIAAHGNFPPINNSTSSTATT